MEDVKDTQSVADAEEQVTQPQDAINRSAAIPPKLVEDVMENPELLRPVARSMAAVNLHNLFVKMSHPATPNKDRLEFQALLNKMAGLEAKEAAQGGGPSVVINITRALDGKEALTIEGASQRLPDVA